MDKDQDKGMNRREFIRKAAITGAVAWAVPAIQTVAATPAYADHSPASPTPTVCEHSPHSNESEVNPCLGSGDDCMSTCKCKCIQQTGQDQGGECAAVCNPNCARGTCPPQYCNPGCWDCTGGEVTFGPC